ncbi:hypothetical protein C0993_001722 [Termitomyces sp. T159_Od127]|nr:hypothetical protein C0993_001722 [Termitomyces sp. T159_Od127]
MDNDLDARCLRHISSFEEELLKPFVDRASLELFNRRWNALNDDLQAALEADVLKPSTITRAHALADRVARLMQTFMDIDALAERLMSSLLGEIASSPPLVHPTLALETTLPPYIKPSHQWLLENIHNPYPSITVRNAIAQESGCPRKDIDNWFKDVRKRIGWNAARKAHFSNKRVAIVDSATRFFANDEKLALSQGAEYALISIMKNAKDLYSDKFDETILASRLTSVMKDPIAATKAAAEAERLRQAQLKKDRDSYPSPDRSPEPTYPSPVPCDDEANIITTRSVSVTSRKRRNPSVEVNQNEETRQEKRLRLEVSTPPFKGVAIPLGLPSPASSVDEPLCDAEPANLPSSPPSAPTLAGKKRRLSESGGQGTSKRRCHHLHNEPRLQIVSDPSPISNKLSFDETSFDGWFQQLFDCPETDKINPSSFSVQLGNLSDLNYQPPGEPHSTSPNLAQTLKPSTTEVADTPTVLDIPWSEFDLGWTGNFSLSSDNPEQSNSLTSLAGQGPLPEPLVQDLANVSPQVSPPVNEFENFFGLSNSSIVDSAVISLNATSNEAWDISESTLNKNDAAILGKYPGFESNIGLLASFNISSGADFLSAPDTFILPIPSQDNLRQEKEREFREACDKAQRLALELQKDALFVQ